MLFLYFSFIIFPQIFSASTNLCLTDDLTLNQVEKYLKRFTDYNEIYDQNLNACESEEFSKGVKA